MEERARLKGKEGAAAGVPRPCALPPTLLAADATSQRWRGRQGARQQPCPQSGAAGRPTGRAELSWVVLACLLAEAGGLAGGWCRYQ